MDMMLVAGAALAFGVSLLRSRRSQDSRLGAVQRRLEPPEPPPPYRPLPLRLAAPPFEAHQPTLHGLLLPGGGMACEADPAEAVQAILDARDALCSYLGQSPEEVARRLARHERRHHLHVPRTAGDPARALERELERGDLPGLPWVVADRTVDLEALARLRRRFGCPVLLLGEGPAPAGFRAL